MCRWFKFIFLLIPVASFSQVQPQYQRFYTTTPVVIRDYRVYLSGSSEVTVTWTTTHEVTNDHFTLEKSRDGITFYSLGLITPKDFNTGSIYTYTDNAPLVENNFYRLSQTDINGTTTYYSILKLNFKTKKPETILLNPNPVKSSTVLEISDQENGPIEILLSDLNGKMTRHWKFEKTDYLWHQNLNIPDISSGIYIVTVIGKKIKQSIQLIKD